MSARGSLAGTAGRRTAGVAFLLVPVLLVWLSVSVYQKKFTDSDPVTIETGAVGNEMHLGAEVKLRGVVIGEVREIESTGSGARLTLAMQPGTLDSVPASVNAQFLPTTLFGERFVALVEPERTEAAGTAAGTGAGVGVGATLQEGAVIPEDRSANAVELQEVIDNVLPLLTAVQPAKLSVTLSAVAQALEGRGDKLGETLEQLDAHLKRFNPHLPALNRDLKELVKVSSVYADAAPDIVDALDDFTTTSSTLAEKESELSTTYGSTTRTAQDLTGFLRQNKDVIIRLSQASRPTLETLAEYSPSFPCTLRTLAQFVPEMDKALGKGTGEPGLHVDVTTVPSRGEYVPGKDTPSYGTGGGPRCYPVPYLGAPVAAPALNADADQNLGPANSPQENSLVNELIAPAVQSDPEALPDWSSLLAGPVYRGTEVKLK